MAFTSSQPLPVSIHPRHWTYDVFLSFRGQDTRNNFTSHLYSALMQRNIKVYKDDKDLEQGKTIESELWKVIEESMFSIVIFSKNYASSTWCLDELVIIINCMNTRGQKVLPIFFDVDPSDVADKKGSYEKAFLQYQEEFKDNKEMVKMWKDALSVAANLSGWDVQDRDQSKIIKEIVERVWSDVSSILLISDKTFLGMDFHIKEMKRLLGEDMAVDVRFIGICGMGGIGKTTISEVIYDRIGWQFEVSCFLANVEETCKDNYGVISLQEQILSKLTRKHNIKIRDAKIGASEIQRCLKNQKVLLIVDDVDGLKHLKMFVGEKNWYGAGSRVIITSRDRHLLSTHGVDAIHEVDVLNDDDAFELFISKAFTKEKPSKDYLELSKFVLAHAKGLPLALSVLGWFLNGRSLTEWRSSIDKLNKTPYKEVTKVLRISFDALEESEKQIFLDIACCFRGMERDWITRILDACGLHPQIGLQVLIEKYLISITRYDEVQMHDQLQAMGRYIANHSRMWNLNDIRQVNTTENKVEVVVLGGKEGWRLPSDFEVVSKLNNLRILVVEARDIPVVEARDIRFLSRVDTDAPTRLFDELRYFEWRFYPFRTLPSSFQPNNLVELHLSNSDIEQLWDGCKVLNCLKTLHLEWCDRLLETPDLTGTPNLEIMEIDTCTNLSKIHPSLLKLKRLTKLVLRHCENLEELPSSIEMESLQILDLSYCHNLKTLPNSIQNLLSLVSLELSFCDSLPSLPSSIVRLKRLKELELYGCSNINELPEDICELTSLKSLDLEATGIRQFPRSTFLMENLEELCFDGDTENQYIDGVKESEVLVIPYLSGMVSLRKLQLVHYNLGEGSIPDDIGCLSKLTYLNLSGNNFISLPRSISQLSELVELILKDCRMLQKLSEIPTNLSILSIDGCIALEELPDSIKLKGPRISAFHCYDCTKLYQNNVGQRIASKLIHQYIKDLSNPANPGSGLDILFPGKKIPSWFSNQTEGHSIAITTPAEMLCGSKSGLMGFAACVLFKSRFNTQALYIRCDIDFTVDKNELVQLKDWPRCYNERPFSSGSDHCWAFYASFHQFESLKDKSISHLRLKFRSDSDLMTFGRCGIRLVSFQDIQELKMDSDISSCEYYDIDATHDDNEESSDMSDIDYLREFRMGRLSSCEAYGIDAIHDDNEESSDMTNIGPLVELKTGGDISSCEDRVIDVVQLTILKNHLI